MTVDGHSARFDVQQDRKWAWHCECGTAGLSCPTELFAMQEHERHRYPLRFVTYSDATTREIMSTTGSDEIRALLAGSLSDPWHLTSGKDQGHE